MGGFILAEATMFFFWVKCTGDLEKEDAFCLILCILHFVFSVCVFNDFPEIGGVSTKRI